MSVVNQTVSRSMGEAVGAAPRLIEKCVDDAVASLQQAEVAAAGEQRQQLSLAWRELLRHRQAVLLEPDKRQLSDEEENAAVPALTD